DHEVGLARRVAEDLHAEARQVVVGGTRRHHLDRTARQAERGRPHAVATGPLHDVLERAGEEVVVEALEAVSLDRQIGHYAASRPSRPTRRTVVIAVRSADTAASRRRPSRRTGPQSSPPW